MVIDVEGDSLVIRVSIMLTWKQNKKGKREREKKRKWKQVQISEPRAGFECSARVVEGVSSADLQQFYFFLPLPFSYLYIMPVDR